MCAISGFFPVTPSGTRLSLDAIKRRLQIFNKYSKDADKMDSKPPLFRADIVLAIPNVVLKPSLDDLQSALNKAVQLILKTSQDIPQWEHLIYHQKQQQKVCVMSLAVCIYLCVCVCSFFFHVHGWMGGKNLSIDCDSHLWNSDPKFFNTCLKFKKTH